LAPTVRTCQPLFPPWRVVLNSAVVGHLTSGLAFQCSSIVKMSTSFASIAICRGCRSTGPIGQGARVAKEKGQWAGGSTARTNAGLAPQFLKNNEIAVKSRSNLRSHRHSDVVELHIRTLCSAHSQSLRQSKQGESRAGHLSFSLPRSRSLSFLGNTAKNHGVGWNPPISCSYT
jgi:hypothetical protein